MPSTFEKSAAEITRASGSNLAFALSVLPRAKRRDMGVFYAFCRVVDDIADDPGLPPEDKRKALESWRTAILENDGTRGVLDAEVCGLRKRYELPPDHFLDIIDGVSMDIEKKRYATFDELIQYCYRVAGAVGLVSIEIFGYRNPRCKAYAENLGYALQLTNIMRDVGEDMESDHRIYLPAEALQMANYSEEELSRCAYNDRFCALMMGTYERAREYFQRAKAALPQEDLSAMRSSEMMRSIYTDILEKMREDGFRVFDKRYRLGKGRMIFLLIRTKFGL